MAKIEKNTDAVYDSSTLGTPKQLVLGVQHLFAMFGATVLVPALTGLDVANALLFAGLGTLLFHLITGRKVPAFLGSSFAFIGGYTAIGGLSGEYGFNTLPYACFGVACAGLVYLVLAALFKAFGAKKVMRYFPPIVTGPIIICIGLTLANSAVNNCSNNWWIALVAIVVVVVANIFGKGMIKIIPILLGVVASYVFAMIVDADSRAKFVQLVGEADWVGLPITWDKTVFSIFGKNFDSGLLVTAIITIMPISLATILASLFGAPANTTYGENTGVLALSKVYDPKVIRLAAYFAVILSFSPKFAAIIQAMPAATMGGVSLVLYGMISAVGVRNGVENQVDFTKSRNVLIAAMIMGLAIGISASAAGAIVFTVGSVTISLSGLAVAALVGIVMNAILPGKDYEFGTNEQGDTAVVNFGSHAK